MSEPVTRNRRAPAEGNGRVISGDVDHERIVAAVREILTAVGEDPAREGLRKTSTEKYDEMVLVKDIGFESMCEHHLLPFLGKAHVAYLPNGKIVGLSKLARVVEILARRPQVQERMTEELADLVMDQLDARGVGEIGRASCRERV